MVKRIKVPQNSRVCIKIRVKGEKIPTDTQGRLVTQVHSPGSSGGVKRGTILFGEKNNPKEMAAQFQLGRLMDQGFWINNIYAVADTKTKEPGWFFVHVWLNWINPEGAESAKALSVKDWGEAGAFIMQLTKESRSYVTVFGNDNFISVNMCGYPVRDPKKHVDQIIPFVIASPAPAPIVLAKEPVASPKASPVVTGGMPINNAMAYAFQAAQSAARR